MAGLIVSAYGFQRSGKTLISYLLAESLRTSLGLDVFSNMIVPGWYNINSLSQIPFNHEPKVLLLDEVYYFLDSRAWQDNKAMTIFLNTIGKQNICFIYTSVSPGMVEKRLRDQSNYSFLVKSTKSIITYELIDVQRHLKRIITIEKTPELFSQLKYDTLQVPDYVDCSLTDFKERVEAFYKPLKIKQLKGEIGEKLSFSPVRL